MYKKLITAFDYATIKKLFSFNKGYTKAILSLFIFSLMGSGLSVFMALSTKYLIDYASNGLLIKAILFGILFAGALLLEMILSNWVSFITVRITEKMRNEIQMKVLQSIFAKEWMSITAYKTGDLLTRIYSDVNSMVIALTTTLPKMLALFFQLLFAFALLFSYDPLLASLTFLITPITILFGMILGYRLRHIQKRINEAESLQRSVINESIQNLIILKTFNYLKNSLKIIENLHKNHFVLVKQKNNVNIKANIMMGFGYRAGFFGAVVFGAFRLSTKSISMGTFTAFLQLVGQVQGPIQGVAASIPQLITALSSVDRIDELLCLPNEGIHDSVGENCYNVTQIRFNNVEFSYNQSKMVLKNISLQINSGDKIAIVGSSGEGKTTLLHVLLNLLEPQSGIVDLIDEMGIAHKVGVNTRKFFSYVPQVNSLFSGTIRDNLFLDEDYDLDRLQLALNTSQCSDFLLDLPDSIDTVIGERGIGLSQGQAQRLTIARALVHNTPILIFDEATSSLDVNTESALINALKVNYPKCTLIAITHRDSLFSICDKVYKLKDGVLHG